MKTLHAVTWLLATTLALPAQAQRAACGASFLTSSATINLEAVDVAGYRYVVALPFTPGGSSVRFGLGSVAPAANKSCFDAASFAGTTLSVPDLGVAGDFYAVTLALVAGSDGVQFDLATASKNPRLIPDAGVRINQASNPFATVDRVSGITYVGYQDRTGGGDKFQSSSDGLAFANPTTLSYSNRSVDSRRTLMPDGKTWRLYQVNPQTGVMTSYQSTDGNAFAPEAGIRYQAQAGDNGSIGVYDLYTAADGALVLVYVGDLHGKNNLRMAKSTDNGLSFSLVKGNVLGDDDAGGGGSTFIDNKTIALADGRRRMLTMRAGELQSFVTTDGYSWSRELGTRIGYRDFAAAGVTVYSLNDPVAVIDQQGRLKVYVAASTSPAGSEAAGNTDWVIVSATWRD